MVRGSIAASESHALRECFARESDYRQGAAELCGQGAAELCPRRFRAFAHRGMVLDVIQQTNITSHLRLVV
jgi:hypothetical protein